MEPDPRVELIEEFQRQAEWRREKAEEHPDDKRNAEAADLFDRLAASARLANPAVVREYRELIDDLAGVEEHTQMLNGIGFTWWPESAEEFCREYIAKRIG